MQMVALENSGTPRSQRHVVPWLGVLMLSCNAILGIDEGKPLEPSSETDASSSGGSGAVNEPAGGGSGTSTAAQGGGSGTNGATAGAGGVAAGGTDGSGGYGAVDSGGGTSGAASGGSGTSGATGSGGGTSGAAGSGGGASGGAAGAGGNGGAGGFGGSCFWDCGSCRVSLTTCCEQVPCDCALSERCQDYNLKPCATPGTSKNFITTVAAMCPPHNVACGWQSCRCLCP